MHYNTTEPFLFFQKPTVFSMDQIEWWPMKYSDLYNITHDFVHGEWQFTDKDDLISRLPDSIKTTQDHRFLNLFETLNKMSVFHRNEKFGENNGRV